MVKKHRGSQTPIPFQNHDHRRCIHSALKDAEKTCLKAGLRLTKLRRQVLAMVWGCHAPVKAYEILEKMHVENPKAAPPTVYRALEFLQHAGLVHRIESLNAYVGCTDPGHPHQGQFLICRECGAVAEIDEPKITALLDEHAGSLGFQSDLQLVEIKGFCPGCSR